MTDPSREQLEAERDFLLKSLDDLEAERAAGGIDEESYQALHDDYTARAAATIRTLRDGVDARPAGAGTSWRRRGVGHRGRRGVRGRSRPHAGVRARRPAPGPDGERKRAEHQCHGQQRDAARHGSKPR